MHPSRGLKSRAWKLGEDTAFPDVFWFSFDFLVNVFFKAWGELNVVIHVIMECAVILEARQMKLLLQNILVHANGTPRRPQVVLGCGTGSTYGRPCGG